MALQVLLVILLSAFAVQFGQFFVCHSSTHGVRHAQPIVKVGERASVPYGVGATAKITVPRTHDTFGDRIFAEAGKMSVELSPNDSRVQTPAEKFFLFQLTTARGKFFLCHCVPPKSSY